MSKTSFVQAATVIFTIVGVAHLYRAVESLPVSLMGWDVPVGVSWVAGVVALFLAYTGYKHWK
jgi:hypothetical protein